MAPVSVDLDVVSLCGPVRVENQDAAAVWKGEKGDVVALVADGMGGYSNGRLAAQIVVRTCLHAVRGRNGQEGPEVLRLALQEAHTSILEAVDAENPDVEAGMGATAVVALVESAGDTPRLHLAHVGDSRAYLIRGRSLLRLTRDHSLVAQLVADGHLDEEQAFGHPDANVVHRALGQSAAFEPEIHPTLDLDVGDRLVLCSDGLHDVLRDQDLLRLVTPAENSREICLRLSQAALEARSQDNVSVACVRIAGLRRRRPTKVED